MACEATSIPADRWAGKNCGLTARRPSKREPLLDASVARVAERGDCATSVDARCRRARIVKTVLSWHFDRSDGLPAAVVDRVATESVFDRLRPNPSSTAWRPNP